MPQMSPLMWTTLFILFTLLLFWVMVKIMFTNQTKFEISSNIKNNKNEMMMNWKW